LHTLVVLLALEGMAVAQPTTGGTIGGGSWSSSGGGDTSSTGMSIPEIDTHGASGPDSWPGLLALAAVGSVLVVMTRARPARRSRTEAWRRRRDVHVTTIRVVVDAMQRPTVMSTLRSLAGYADTTTLDGQTELVHEVSLVLRRASAGWLYASIDTPAALTKQEARLVLARLVGNERARFDTDRIRNIDGRIVTARGPSRGPAVRGLAVVTVLVATRGDALDFTIVDRASLARALAWLSNTLPTQLLAANVVWSPADGAEPFDSIAVEARFADLTLLDGATAGTVVCAHCNGRFSAESGRCGTCGSPHLPRAVA
jgi:uncharacterized membrane protein